MSNPSAKQHFDNGITNINQGRFLKAIDDFTKVIEIDPNYALAYTNRGSAKIELKQYHEAIEDYNKAIEINPIHADNYYNRGLTKGKLKQYHEAIEDYDKTIEINPTYVLAYNNRGNAKNKLKQYHEAIDDYNKVIAIDPNHADIYINRGNTKANLKQYQEAIDDYNQAIAIDPNHTKAYSNRGTTKGELKQYHEAIKDFNKTIAIDLDDAHAYYNRGETYRYLGDEQQALKDFQKANELDPTLISKERLKEISKKVEHLSEAQEKERKQTEEFEDTLKNAINEYKANQKKWLWISSVFSIIVLSAIALMVLPDVILSKIYSPLANLKSSNKQNDLLFAIPIILFLSTLNFIIIRQYTNAKKLTIETKNRLIANKMFDRLRVTEKDEDIKKLAYPRLIDEIVSSPYNQGNKENSHLDNSTLLSTMLALLNKEKDKK
jgi:tetratricopeptide (TPR) repeat protein